MIKLILLVFTSIVILLGIIIALLPVKISVDYYRLNKDDNLKIQVEGLFGLLYYRLEFSYIKIRRWILGPILELEAEFLGVKGKKEPEKIKEEFGLHSIDLRKIYEKVRFLLKVTDMYEALMEMMETYKEEERSDDEIRMENVLIYRVMGMLYMGLKGDCHKLIFHTHYGFSDAAITGVANGVIWAIKGIFLDIISAICTMKTQPEISVTPHFEATGVDIQFESIFRVRIGNLMYTGLKIIWQGYKRRAFKRWPIIQLKH